MEAYHVPGLSGESGVHHGGRGVHRRVRRARGEKSRDQMAGINEARFNKQK
jgi:hypothetical protein